MSKCKYNWKQIQKEYDSGQSWRDLKKTYGFSFSTIAKAVKTNKVKSRSRCEGIALKRKQKPELFKHTQVTKNKLSKIRIKHLKKNPDQVPYLLNHYSKGDSYPETYFKEVFEKENIPLKHHYQIGLYQLDFYNLDKKIDIEIDGEQHYVDKRIKQSDKKRTRYLNKLGWKVFRIRWSDYQKLTFSDKNFIINHIRQMIF